MATGASELFGQALVYPDPSARRRLDRLVGIDSQKERLRAQLRTLIDPSGVTAWAKKRGYDRAHYLLDSFHARPPLVILAGDVGAGKTELAETIPDPVARDLGIEITLYPLSLASRGGGLVGEMTRLVTSAFSVVASAAEKLVSKSGAKARGGIVLLIDEADALAQSREAMQMHHEDKAGVNALIRGINSLSVSGLPVCVVMCTNRLGALDPAICRRAADLIEFGRPDEDHRAELLKEALGPAGFSDKDIKTLAELTGPQGDRGYGFTYSDLTQKLLPNLILNAYPDQSIDFALAKSVIASMSPTPPFAEGAT